MPLTFRCPGCDSALTISRRHRGRFVRCPRCRADVDVPHELAFGDLARGAAADRRRGHWLLTGSWVSGLIWMPVVPAVVLFLVTQHIRRAGDDGRPVVGPLHAARVVATTALCAQTLHYVLFFMGWWTFLRLPFEID